MKVRNNLTWWLFAGGTIGVLLTAAIVSAMPASSAAAKPESVGLRVENLGISDVATLAGGHFVIADSTITFELSDGVVPAWRQLDAGARPVRSPAFAVKEIGNETPPLTVLMRADSPIAEEWNAAVDRILRRADDGLIELVLIPDGDGAATCYGLFAPANGAAATVMLASVADGI